MGGASCASRTQCVPLKKYFKDVLDINCVPRKEGAGLVGCLEKNLEGIELLLLFLCICT